MAQQYIKNCLTMHWRFTYPSPMPKQRVVVYLAEDEERVLTWAKQELRLDASATLRHVLLEWMRERNAHLFKSATELLGAAKAQILKEQGMQ